MLLPKVRGFNREYIRVHIVKYSFRRRKKSVKKTSSIRAATLLTVELETHNMNSLKLIK
jgi:hypothetical protein